MKIFVFLRLSILSALSVVFMAQAGMAQSSRVSTFLVEGNQRIETATIQSIAGLDRGAVVTDAELNAAVQRVRASGLFSDVSVEQRGSTLVLRVVEFPTINKVAFEGNARLKDDALVRIVRSQSRRVYQADVVEEDADRIAEAYANQGRLTATVTPRIIRRSDNRVDVVYEIVEGGVVEIQRISFVGNRSFSDRRLRRVLESKQAGFFRLLVSRDTYVEDRIAFDKQVLRDFYQSRGYVDFQTLNVNAELSKGRDGFFVTFRVREGQKFTFGEISTSSSLSDVDAADFDSALKLKTGATYSPTLIENSITRLERRALELGLDFVRVEPRVTRNDADLTLDIDFVLSRGPRVFVERIDIEGNTTTLDRVVRRQFDIVEGDPFNPREIRASAERIRALGYFGNADVNAREGSDPSQVIIEVDVEEKPTGSLSFGANYNTSDGIGLLASFKESNFLGRGQKLNFSLSTGAESQRLSFNFVEPALLDRDLALGLDFSYIRTDNNNALYDTNSLRFAPSLGFPISENGRLTLRAFAQSERINDVSTTSTIILADELAGRRTTYGLGYSYSFDNRRTGLNPNAGVFLRFGQDFAIGGSDDFITTTLSMGAETKILQEEVTLTAVLDAGALTFGNGASRITDRFFLGSNRFRGFEPGGLGPRQDDGTNDDALGGNYYAVARFEARFPLGLPEEYGISGGVFYDVGSLWGLDDATTAGQTGVLYEDLTLRSVAGVSLFWNTPIGPLRFNFTEALDKQPQDVAQNFDLTISTSF